MGDYGGAVDLVKQALRLQPDNADFKYKIELYEGWKCKHQGNKSGARRHFEAAMEVAPTTASRRAAQDELDELSGKKRGGGSLGGLLGFGKKKKKK